MNTLYLDRGKEQLHLFSCHVHVYKVDVFYQNTWAAAYIEQAKGEGTFNRIFFFFLHFIHWDQCSLIEAIIIILI